MLNCILILHLDQFVPVENWTAKMKDETAIKFRTFNPRRNLPPAIGRKRGESNFVAAFHRNFVVDRGGQGAGGRHFEMAGYGIADFVWMDFGADRADDRTGAGEMVLTAFEMKLKDWRQACSQAYRYSYFSDRSIVVLPPEAADRAEEHLHFFKQMGIGLWSFEPKTQRIEMRFTPHGSKAKNPSAREKAVSRISGKINLSKGRE